MSPNNSVDLGFMICVEKALELYYFVIFAVPEIASDSPLISSLCFCENERNYTFHGELKSLLLSCCWVEQLVCQCFAMWIWKSRRRICTIPSLQHPSAARRWYCEARRITSNNWDKDDDTTKQQQIDRHVIMTLLLMMINNNSWIDFPWQRIILAICTSFTKRNGGGNADRYKQEEGRKESICKITYRNLHCFFALCYTILDKMVRPCCSFCSLLLLLL